MTRKQTKGRADLLSVLPAFQVAMIHAYCLLSLDWPEKQDGLIYIIVCPLSGYGAVVKNGSGIPVIGMEVLDHEILSEESKIQNCILY